MEDAEALIRFLKVARAAWGSDPQHGRLWTNLNLCVCMWLWRNLVVNRERGVKRFVVLTADQFKRCLMTLSASGDYVDWLVGRNMNDRDRSPCFVRIKTAFVQRLREDGDAKAKMPQPSWAS